MSHKETRVCLLGPRQIPRNLPPPPLSRSALTPLFPSQYFADLVTSKLDSIFRAIVEGRTDKFDPDGLTRYLKTHLNYTAKAGEAEEAIWEIDDDHDGKVSWAEFQLAVSRCIHDERAREPQQIFNFVLFAVFSQASPILSKHNLKHLLYLRFGKDVAESKLVQGFGSDGSNAVTLDQFVRGMSLVI